jgi:hypothetical protein
MKTFARAVAAQGLPLAIALLLAAIVGPGGAHADGPDKIDAEHIFGFTEGTDIGKKGEKEVENNTIIRFGKLGSYSAIENETAYRYVISDSLRLSLGGLLDYHCVHDVPELANRQEFNFRGLNSEFRWHVLDRNPIGLTLSLAPQWERIDSLSAAHIESYASPASILVDASPIPKKLFAAVNLTYTPSVIRSDSTWHHNDVLELSAAMAYATGPDVFVGAEARHLSGSGVDQKGLFAAHGLFVGPSVYFKLSDTMTLKAAWSFQVVDETTHHADLTNFERNQVLFQLVKDF